MMSSCPKVSRIPYIFTYPNKSPCELCHTFTQRLRPSRHLHLPSTKERDAACDQGLLHPHFRAKEIKYAHLWARWSVPVCEGGGVAAHGNNGVFGFTFPSGDYGSPGILQRLLTQGHSRMVCYPGWRVIGAFGDKACILPFAAVLLTANRRHA